jgi:DNA-directed RNA polymerase specialized sigma24 family protein
VTDPGLNLYDWDDAQLLNLVRAGNTEAFDVVHERHASAARKLARQLVSSPAQAEDAIAETFERVLEVTHRGGGPSHAVRPYLLTALRRVCQERRGSLPSRLLQDDQKMSDPGEPLVDPAVAGVEQTLVSRAYLALPERWRAVLWYTEIEQAHPLVISPLLGLTQDGIGALNRHALDDLRQVCLQLYGASIARRECASVAERLGDYMRDALPLPDDAEVSEHLDGCGDCTWLGDEVAEIASALPRFVGPLILGAAAGAYLGVTAAPGAIEPAGTAQARVGSLAGRAKVAAATTTRARSSRRHTRRRVPTGLGVAAGVTLVTLVSGAVALALNSSPSGSAGRATASRPSPPVVTQRPTLPSSMSPRPSRTRVVAMPSHRSGPGSGASTLTTLSVSMNVTPSFDRSRSGNSDVVGFKVSNTGKAATGQLTVTFDLPPGSEPATTDPGTQPAGGGGTPMGTAVSANDVGGFGWSCDPTQDGITCMHAPVPAGQHVGGRLMINIFGFDTCGQPVQMTASSGRASAKAVNKLAC